MKPLLRIILILLVPALVAALTYKVVYSTFNNPVDPADSNLQLIEIAPDTSFREICKKIASADLLKHWWVLEALARLKKIDKNVNAGEYQLSRNMPPAEILRKLTSGEVFKRRVTVREGLSVWEIGKLVEEAGILPKVEFDQAVADAKLLAVAGLNAPSFEGYLFPETYFFSRPTTAKAIIFSMLELG